jgi:hypothetical protein
MTKVFCDALLASHPARDVAGTNDIYAPLIGSWTTEVLDAEEDGSKRVTDGEWHFVRVLEGRGVQDVLIVPSRDQRHPRGSSRFNRYGSSLRIFDARDGTWRVQWCNPGDGELFMLESQRSGTDIVETGDDRNGSIRRWTIFDIKQDSFLARGETRGRGNGDGAADWKTVVEIYARREDSTGRMLADAARP